MPLRLCRALRRLRVTTANLVTGDGQCDGVASMVATGTVLGTSPNQPPVPRISTPQADFIATVGVAVPLDPTGTFDPEGAWNGTWTVVGGANLDVVRLSHVGTFGNFASQIASWTPTVAEDVRVAFDVMDEQGATGTTSVSGTVRAAPAPTTLTVAPNSFTLNPGDTALLTGTVKDQYGAAMSGQTITWSSGATARATVSPSSGSQTTVTAQSQTGAVTITAASGTLSGTSTGTIAAPNASHPNEPPGMTPVTTRPFNAATGENGWFSSGVTVLADAGAPSGSVGRMTFGAGLGNTTLAGNAPGNTSYTPGAGLQFRTIYVDFWLKLSANWYGHFNASKIVIPWIKGKPCCVLGQIGGGNAAQFTQMRLQDLAGNDYNGGSAVNLGPNGGRSNVEITRGVYHRVEIIATANTPGVNDGTVKWWIDGQLIGDWGGIGWSAVGQSNYWENFQWTPVWGGGPSDIPADQFMYVDDIYWSGK